MADATTVCSMCGDVGFPDKLFQCTRCLSRFQHSYCSNYYQEDASEAARICDWCLSEGRTSGRHLSSSSSSKKYAVKDRSATGNRGERMSDQESRTRSKSSGSSSSSKHAGRRYKLLKDVLC